MHPWSAPVMLTRCWCLYELNAILASEKQVEMAMVPSEEISFRDAISGNFGSIMMTMCACVDSEKAQATRAEDKEYIFRRIRARMGFKELNIRVLTLLNMWLRRAEMNTKDGSTAGQFSRRPVREQVVDFVGRLDAIKSKVAALGLDPTVHHRSEDGVLSIGGKGGIIIGCTDASKYLSPANPTTDKAAVVPDDSDSATRVDHAAPAHLRAGKVLGGYSASLLQTNLGGNNNKYFLLQLVVCADGSTTLYTRWGRAGESGASNMMSGSDEGETIKMFERKYREKTKNVWGDSPFREYPGKYRLTKAGEYDGLTPGRR